MKHEPIYTVRKGHHFDGPTIGQKPNRHVMRRLLLMPNTDGIAPSHAEPCMLYFVLAKTMPKSRRQNLKAHSDNKAKYLRQ